MTRRRILLIVLVVITIGAIGAWAATGREAFTKFTKIEEVTREPDPEDPLDLVAVEEDGLVHETVRREGFYFGLLPAGQPRPGHWLDPHMLSVLSIVGPAWVIGAALLWLWRPRPSNAGGDGAPPDSTRANSTERS